MGFKSIKVYSNDGFYILFIFYTKLYIYNERIQSLRIPKLQKLIKIFNILSI